MSEPFRLRKERIFPAYGTKGCSSVERESTCQSSRPAAWSTTSHTQPPGAEGRKALCVVAQLLRIAEIERIDDSLQPLAFHFLYASQQCGAAIGRNADGWAADDRRCDALWTSCRGVQGDGAADGNTGERDLAGNAERVQQRNQVVDHAVDGERRTYFLRQSSAAGVVTQHAALRGKRGRDQVPALDRSTHFVD